MSNNLSATPGKKNCGAHDRLSTSQKFAKNAIFNVAGFVVTFPILILLTPYMLEVLGKAKFGVWALAGVVTSYAQLSDMGLTTALVKFVAEHWAKRDVEMINTIVSTAFFSFAIVGGLIAGGIILIRHFIVASLLKVPLELQAEALFVVSGVVVVFYFNLVFGVYNSVLQGIQRMDVTNGIMVVSKVLRAGGMYFFLANGFGLKGLVINSAIFSVLTIAANVVYVSLLVHGLRLQIFSCSLKTLKRIGSYSANILAARLIGLGENPINKIILSRWGSLTWVAFYDIGYQVAGMVERIFQIGLPALLPASSELYSKGDKEGLMHSYLMLSRFLYLFGVPFFLLIVVVAQPLVRIWLGEGYMLAARAIQFVMIAHLANLLVTPQYIILQGIGKPHLNTFNHIVASTINIVGSICLILYLGFHGVLIAMVFSCGIAAVHLDVLTRKALKISLKEYMSVFPLRWMVGVSMWSLGLWVIVSLSVHWTMWHLTGLVFSTLGFYFGLFLLSTPNCDKLLLVKLIRVGVGSFLGTNKAMRCAQVAEGLLRI